MRKVTRLRFKKRFYILAVSLSALVLCISSVKMIHSSPDKVQIIPAVVQEENVPDSYTGRSFTVCLDPGHGEYDDGTSSASGVKEKDINLDVALRIGELLEKSNVNVVYTRKTDEIEGDTQRESLKLRCDVANKADSDIFVSIHCNFDEVSTKTNGTEIWCRFPNENAEKLALNVQKLLTGIGYTRDRGIKYESNGGKYVLKNTKATAVLIELGFLSNPADSSYLESEDGKQKCAEAIAKSILEYAVEV